MRIFAESKLILRRTISSVILHVCTCTLFSKRIADVYPHFVLQVTVFGQSSGGTAIFALLASPLCQGLFHKAWMISGSPLMKKTAAEAYKDNEIFMRNAHCTTLSCLYALTAAEVTSAVPWDTYPFWSMADQNDPPIKNVFDGALAIVDGMLMLIYFLHSSYNAFVVDSRYLNSLTSKKQTTKFLSTNFQKMLSPSYIILRNQRLEGK